MADAVQAPARAEGPTQHTPNPNANTFGYSREEQIAALHKLREPFDEKEIRYLPRIWCKACKDSRGQGCQQHRFGKCNKCQQRMPNGGHIDLRYVGHAEATNRLLNVDPFWSWEPMTTDERGLPTFDGYRGLWIRLTVCGMSRLGYGHAGEKTGGDAIKEVIGDAIRNAGMRFGMALDLWTSSDLLILEHGSDEPGDGEQTKPVAQKPRAVEQAPAAATANGPQDEPLAALKAKVNNGWNNADSMRQNLEEARRKGLLEQVVPFNGGPMRLGDMIQHRIDELDGAGQRAA